jgi:NAD(P)-dependent dehydrogenase (short-subunit alcohol dehydrogenase family)
MTPARVAIVTGAAGGMGQAFVAALLGRGMRVLAVDRQVAPLRALEKAMHAAHGEDRMRALVADQCAPGASDLIVAAALRDLGGLDVLVNNAGIGQGSIRADNWHNPLKFWEVEHEHWERFFAVNSTATFLLSKASAPHMVGRKWGRIVNITTSLGSMLRRGYTPYGPSKAAAEALTSVMAHDLAGTGVTANVLVPGAVTNTPMVPDASRFDRSKLLQPEAMVAPLLYLASEEAGEVTGQRFLAIDWDPTLPAPAAAAKAGAPVAWRGIATMPVFPT